MLGLGITDQETFSSFARDFVRAYWQTVKSREFPMPPNEAVEKTVEELLSAVSHSTEVQPSFGRSGVLYKLLMTSKHGAWWLFTFRATAAGWTLVGCSARSDDDSKPHDLLDSVYSQYFEPFLRHVTDAASAQNRIYQHAGQVQPHVLP